MSTALTAKGNGWSGAGRRDFVDHLYTMLQTLPFCAVARNAVRGFGPTLIEPVVVGRALVWFADADGQPDPLYVGTPVPWSAVKRFFRSSVPRFVLDLDAERVDAAHE